MRSALKNAGRLSALTVAYVVLFLAGSQVFAPEIPGPVPGPAEASQVLAAVLAIAVVDSALVLAVVRTSRLHGVALMAVVSGVFYFVKTATSQIEAAYFMPNVTGPMLPGLLMMTVPLSLGLGPLAVWVGGRAKAGPLDERPPWASLPMEAREAWLKIGALSVVVYPALFFAAGWFIAFRSDEVRAFYGGAHGGDVVSHYVWVFQHDPFIYLLEIFRSALWIAAALPLLRTTRGPWWVGTLHAALWFSLVQNDVHWLPNPLMTAGIRLYHFVETGSSNFIWAWCIGWALSRSWGRGFGRPSSRAAEEPRARGAE